MPMPLIKIILFALFAINTLRMAWTGWPLPFPLLLPHFSALPWNWCFVAQMDNWIPLRSTCLKDQRPKGFCTRKISEKYGKAKYYLLLRISSSSGWMSKFGPRDHWREAAASSNLPDGHHLGIWWWSSWYLVINDHHPREDCQIIFYHLWRQASKEILWRRTMQVPSELAEWQMMFENIKTISSGDSPPYSPVMRGWSTWFSSGKGSQEGKTQTFRGQGISMKRLLRR